MRVTRPFSRLAALLLLAMALTACGVDAGSEPTLTPDAALPATAAALFPTLIPTAAPTATPVAESNHSEEIARLLGNLQNALITRDGAGYLALTDLSDPVFALEHTRWVEDWDKPTGGVLRYTLTMRNLVISDDATTATADLNAAWSTLANVQVSRGADYPVRFTRAEDGRWLYAGELWAATVETDHFIIKAMPGQEALAQAMTEFLPDVFERVTTALEHTPTGRQQIKIYDNPWAMIATIRLSLTTEIGGWNEPGESLKITSDRAADERTIAHEFAHYLMFDLANTTRGQYPWWVSEGIAQYAASAFWTQSDRNRAIADLLEERRTNGLIDWNDLAEFESTPESLWRYAYTQGYAFMAYLTDTYGEAARNAWMRGMVDGTLEAATEATFEMPFNELNAGFLAWLDAQAR